MAHRLNRSGYSQLVDRLNRFPQGAPPSHLLNSILKILFSEQEAKLAHELCLGCGICVRACTNNALILIERDQRVITPLDSTHRTVIMAIERGKLQELLFDNHVLFSHRALAAVFKVIFTLPPVKQLLASRQIKSQYLERLLKKAA